MNRSDLLKALAIAPIAIVASNVQVAEASDWKSNFNHNKEIEDTFALIDEAFANNKRNAAGFANDIESIDIHTEDGERHEFWDSILKQFNAGKDEISWDEDQEVFKFRMSGSPQKIEIDKFSVISNNILNHIFTFEDPEDKRSIVDEINANSYGTANTGASAIIQGLEQEKNQDLEDALQDFVKVLKGLVVAGYIATGDKYVPIVKKNSYYQLLDAVIGKVVAYNEIQEGEHTLIGEVLLAIGKINEGEKGKLKNATSKATMRNPLGDGVDAKIKKALTDGSVTVIKSALKDLEDFENISVLMMRESKTYRDVMVERITKDKDTTLAFKDLGGKFERSEIRSFKRAVEKLLSAVGSEKKLSSVDDMAESNDTFLANLISAVGALQSRVRRLMKKTSTGPGADSLTDTNTGTYSLMEEWQ